MMRALLASTFLIAVCASDAATAQTDAQTDIEFSSGVEQVALLELYTSEGCSSCPPADRWLSSLTTHAKLWETFVPIALHVDYWDYIGWEDRFARREFSHRQRLYAHQGSARSVYTPGFFAAGNEWLGWRNGEYVIPSRREVGILSVRANDTSVAIRFDPVQSIDGELIAHVALLGMGLETEVRAGENRDRKLRHDFVALSVTSTGLTRKRTAHSAILQLPESDVKDERLALAIWVSSTDRLAPIQATGGFLN